MAGKTKVIGRATTAFVFGPSNNQKAVISAIVVRRTGRADRERLRYTGAVKFSDTVTGHIQDTILPIIDRILAGLGLPQANFEISAVNLGAASTLDVGINISGYSADIAVFAACLSEGLQTPLTNDFVVTGHIASLEGDIAAVRAIPTKLEGVKTDETIRRFIYPDLEKDRSLKALSPKERERSITAIMAASPLVFLVISSDNSWNTFAASFDLILSTGVTVWVRALSCLRSPWRNDSTFCDFSCESSTSYLMIVMLGIFMVNQR